ncbi:hypothetical protein M2162_000175 [Streptomyces sp. SAI-041]|nr:hypothetical protein [Streptomyces sp. SAI-041]
MNTAATRRVPLLLTRLQYSPAVCGCSARSRMTKSGGHNRAVRVDVDRLDLGVPQAGDAAPGGRRAALGRCRAEDGAALPGRSFEQQHSRPGGFATGALTWNSSRPCRHCDTPFPSRGKPQAGQLARAFPGGGAARHPPEGRAPAVRGGVTHNLVLHFTQELGKYLLSPTAGWPTSAEQLAPHFCDRRQRPGHGRRSAVVQSAPRVHQRVATAEQERTHHFGFAYRLDVET